MNREQIMRMAREAGLNPIYSACDEPDVSYAYEDWDEEIEKFAALVAAQEREACADICDQHATCEGVAQLCAEAIRSRT